MASMFRVHLHNGRNLGKPISCQIRTREGAERWIAEWKACVTKYQNDDAWDTDEQEFIMVSGWQFDLVEETV